MQLATKLGWACFSLIGTMVLFAMTAPGQSSGGTYAVERAVVAPGGNSGNGLVALDGTIGQPAAGTRSVNSPYVVTGGFWTAPLPAPTAATAQIGGRVITSNGQGLLNALVLLTAQNGEQRTARTGSFGYFQFPEVQSGLTYVISIESRRCSFRGSWRNSSHRFGKFSSFARSTCRCHKWRWNCRFPPPRLERVSSGRDKSFARF